MLFEQTLDSSDAANEWAGWTLAPGGGADYAHHITASPPGFENPAASLQAFD